MSEPKTGDGPSDPTTPLEDDMTNLHELYVSFLAGGFTKDEALSLIAKSIAEGNRQNGTT